MLPVLYQVLKQVNNQYRKYFNWFDTIPNSNVLFYIDVPETKKPKELDILINNTSHEGYTRKKFFYGWYIVATSWIMLFFLAATSAGLYFKPILDEFGWKRDILSLVSAIVMLVAAVIMPFMGRLIDHFGTRIMICAMLSIQVLSNITYFFSGNLGTISLGRLLAEFKPTTASQVVINQWFVKWRGRALGIISTGTPLGTLILSPISQLLINSWGWRYTLLFWAGITLVFILPLSFIIRNKPEDKGFYPDGDLNINKTKSDLPSIHQASKPFNGSTIKEALNNKSFWLLTITQFLCGVGCGLWMTHIVIFATDLGYTSMIGASFLSVQGALSMVGVLVTGQMSDFWARNKVLGMTHFIRACSFFVIIFALLFAGKSLWMIYLAMVLFGFGWFATAPLAGGLVADLFGNQRMGTIIGLTMASHMVGSAIGTYGGGLIFTVTGSYLDIFIIQGILELIAMVLAFGIKHKKLVLYPRT